MHIAIIGAGLTGVATSWHLLQNSLVKVTVFDPAGIGGGTSGIAAGLMHPYAGAHAKLNVHGKEGWTATCGLIKIAENALGTQVAEQSGLLRVALNEEQYKDFALCAKNHPEVIWYAPEQCRTIFPNLICLGGIFISCAITVNTKHYLQGLWQACEERGALLNKHKISSLSELEGFDAVVIAAGANANAFANLPLTQVKGQIIELAWPEGIEMAKCPLNSQAYLLMNPARGSCIAGATFERNFSDPGPFLDQALKELMPKISALVPNLEHSHVIDCRAGVRASTPSHLPLLKRLSEKCWVLTGMGSKGLLYHALYAEQLASEILSTL